MPQTLAQLVRAKYPGAYDDLSDSQLESQVKAKFPGVYDDIPTTAPTSSSVPQASATSRFLSNAGEMLNPVTAASGLYNAVRHPSDTAKAIYEASADQFAKAKDAYEKGNYTEAVGHLGGMIPLIGPAAAQAGEQIASGDVAGGLGKATGLLIPAGAPSVLRGASAAARVAVPSGLRAIVADSLAAKAAEGVADVMAPKVGANKVRLGNTAATVAPDMLASEVTNTYSRAGLATNVAAKLDEATQALDAASDARLSARSVPTQPIINDLLSKRAKLTSTALDASQSTAQTVTKTSPLVDARGNPIMTTSQQATPIGQNVVPAPYRARVAQIDQAISELKQLGPVTRYDQLKNLRQAYDGPAKTVYSPSTTQDYLAKQGEALGAADVTGTLRNTLATMDPETAKANAQYSLWKSASDVLQATAETERTRPTVGRQLVARMTGSVLGEQLGGAAGAVAGYAAGPAVDALASSGWTTKLQTAQMLSKLANAIRLGDVGTVTTVSSQLKRLASQGGVLVNQATSPTGFQTLPAGAR